MNRFISLLFMAAVALGAVADRFYIEDFTVAPGATVTVPLMLENELSYTAFQADVTLPEELSVDVDDAACGFSLTGRKGNHLLSVNRLPSGVFRLVSYSGSLDTYSGHSDALLTVTLTADSTFSGSAVVTLANVRFTTPAAVEYLFDDQTCTVTSALLLGDVNGDGLVNITDVSALIDYLLDDNTPINTCNADVNSDDEITIKDLVALIDLFV